MNQFLPRFREILKESGKKQKEICEEIGISKQKLSNWKTGYSEPNFDDILLLANYFETSIDYLLGNSNEFDTFQNTKKNSTRYTREEEKLIEDYRTLSTPLKKMIQDTIKTWKTEITKQGEII